MDINTIFTRHYKKYYPLIFSIVRKSFFIKNEQEDIASEIWIKIYKRLKENKIDISNEKRAKNLYIFIAKNHCIDVYRTHIRKQLLIDEIDFINNDDSNVESEKLISDIFNLAEELLNQRQLKLFKLRYTEGQSFDVISKDTGINKITCRGTVARAIIKLKESNLCHYV